MRKFLFIFLVLIIFPNAGESNQDIGMEPYFMYWRSNPDTPVNFSYLIDKPAGRDGFITSLIKLPTYASLGWFYSNVTEALGWYHGDGEGKTMGLAPYGDYSAVRGKLDPFYPKFDSGQLQNKHDYGRPYYWNEHGAMQ